METTIKTVRAVIDGIECIKNGKRMTILAPARMNDTELGGWRYRNLEAIIAFKTEGIVPEVEVVAGREKAIKKLEFKHCELTHLVTGDVKTVFVFKGGVQLPFSTNDRETMCQAIDHLPSDIAEIKVPVQVEDYQPKRLKFSPAISNDWKELVKSTINKASTKYKRKPEVYWMSGYGGESMAKGGMALYISYDDAQSKQFAENMQAGIYGKLD